jgi:Fe2+ transport system protein FeoA
MIYETQVVMEKQAKTRTPIQETTGTLAALKPGDSALVDHLALDGEDRRRLMDLGLVPGTRITAEFRSALGDPVAYRIRGTLIALRKAQARQIMIRPVEKQTDQEKIRYE